MNALVERTLEGRTEFLTEIETEHGAEPEILVYLRNGRTERLAPATAVRLTAAQMLVFNGENIVAHYRRNEVFFASDVPVAPPILF